MNAVLAEEMGAHLYSLHRSVERSSTQIRILGVFFLLLGSINLIMGAKDAKWATIAESICFQALGVSGVYAGWARTTRSAKAYFAALILFITAFTVIGVTDTATLQDPPAWGFVAGIVINLLFPTVICAACVYCARVHWVHCRDRDTLLVLHAPGAGLPPAGVPFIVADHAQPMALPPAPVHAPPAPVPVAAAPAVPVPVPVPMPPSASVSAVGGAVSGVAGAEPVLPPQA
jgi:hypothetical protein